MSLKVLLVAGARPNFTKIGPLWLAMHKCASFFEPIILHTGQHYDYEMSKVFFEDLELPDTNYFLGVGSGNHGEQTAKIIEEKIQLILSGNWKQGRIPELWDGEAGQRTANILKRMEF